MELSVNIESPDNSEMKLKFNWVEGLLCEQMRQFILTNYKKFCLYDEFRFIQGPRELKLTDAITEKSIRIVVGERKMPEKLTLHRLFKDMQETFSFSDSAKVAFVVSGGQWSKKIANFSKNAEFEEIVFIDENQIYQTNLPKDIFDTCKAKLSVRSEQVSQVNAPVEIKEQAPKKGKEQISKNTITLRLEDQDYDITLECPLHLTNEELSNYLMKEMSIPEGFTLTLLLRTRDNKRVRKDIGEFKVTDYIYPVVITRNGVVQQKYIVDYLKRNGLFVKKKKEKQKVMMKFICNGNEGEIDVSGMKTYEDIKKSYCLCDTFNIPRFCTVDLYKDQRPLQDKDAIDVSIVPIVKYEENTSLH
jgi:hypothetical protein